MWVRFRYISFSADVLKLTVYLSRQYRRCFHRQSATETNDRIHAELMLISAHHILDPRATFLSSSCVYLLKRVVRTHNYRLLNGLQALERQDSA